MSNDQEVKLNKQRSHSTFTTNWELQITLRLESFNFFELQKIFLVMNEWMNEWINMGSTDTLQTPVADFWEKINQFSTDQVVEIHLI